jgi:hypothetical protein
MARSTPSTTLAELKALLQEAAKTPPLRSTSAYDTVRGLYPDIQELKAKRFTDKEIVDMLATKGFEISLGTFRQYLQRLAREPRAETPRTPRKHTRTIKPRTEKSRSNQDANVDTTSHPKPSDLAISSGAKAGTGAKATGHRLSDNDL